mgnify:CR=1 FL=1
MYRSIRMLIIAAASAMVIVSPTIARAEIRIGFVDPVALIQNAPQSQAALKQLELEFRPRNDDILELQERMRALESVSYTHLTLPTSDLV